MAIQDALATRLAANANLTALVSDRIYWNKGPANPALPCLVYRRIGGGPVRAMGANTGMNLSRWVFVALGKDVDDPSAVMAEVQISLDRLHDTTVDGIFIDSIFLEDAEDTDLEPDLATPAAGAVYSVNYRD